METLFLSASDPNCAETAANIIKNDGLVAIPTETVYGLGANGLDEDAVAKIFLAKGRPQDNPLILHISGAEQIELFCHHIPQKAYDLAEKFWPGPLTIVLPARESVPKRTTGGLSTVAVRCPDNDVTREIIRLSGIREGQSSMTIDDEAVMRRVEGNRYLRCTLVDVQWDSVTLHLKERAQAAGSNYNGMIVVLDNRGFVLEDSLASETG